MERITLYLLFSDDDYALALSKGLQLVDHFFSITILPRRGKGTLRLPENSILLTDLPIGRGPGIIRMESRWEDSSLPKPEEHPAGAISMYQPARLVAAHIKTMYSRITGRRLQRSQSAAALRILGVASAKGGAGCTTLALALCQEFRCHRGKEVLYLSMEDFPSTRVYFPGETIPGGIARMIGKMEGRSASDSELFQSYELTDGHGVRTLMPPPGRNPLRELEPEVLMDFIDRIGCLGRYEMLVADCGNGLDGTVRQIAGLAENWIFISGKGPQEQGRALAYRNCLERGLKPGQEIQWIEVDNRNAGELRHDAGTELGNTGISIPEDQGCLCQTGVSWTINLDSGIGESIRNIADLIEGDQPKKISMPGGHVI